jgi:(S)-ureidoglycine aminohydrolase
MNPEHFPRSGQTRSVLRRDHALISPDGHVPSPLPSWNGASGIVLISPAIGAKLAQTLVNLEVGAVHFAPAAGIEAVFYVLEGELATEGQTLTSGSYGFLPADQTFDFQVQSAAKLCVFEKRFTPKTGLDAPKKLFGHAQNIESQPFLGDPDARLQVLLPESPDFDLAMNIFTFQPGATLPFVETHIMEHGLLMLDGGGIYRLNHNWYPVAAGDCLWMAPFCPQWFAATGKTPARYLYYKDVNRDAMESL